MNFKPLNYQQYDDQPQGAVLQNNDLLNRAPSPVDLKTYSPGIHQNLNFQTVYPLTYEILYKPPIIPKDITAPTFRESITTLPVINTNQIISNNPIAQSVNFEYKPKHIPYELQYNTNYLSFLADTVDVKSNGQRLTYLQPSASLIGLNQSISKNASPEKEVKLVQQDYSNNLFSVNHFTNKQGEKYVSIDIVGNSQIIQNSSNDPKAKTKQLLFIKDIFETYLDFEIQIEKAKQDLVKFSDFSIENLFKMFDREKNQEVTCEELQKKIGIEADLEDIQLVAKRYSRDGNLDLKLFYFISLFLKVHKNLKICLYPLIINLKICNTHGKIINSLTYEHINRLLKLHLNVEYSIEQIRKEVHGKKLNFKVLFKEIDENENETISVEELQRYLNKIGLNIKEKGAILSLMNRFDRNDSGQINFPEFVYEFAPRTKK